MSSVTLTSRANSIPASVGLLIVPVIVGGLIASGHWAIALALCVVVLVPVTTPFVPAFPVAVLFVGLFTAFFDLPTVKRPFTIADVLLVAAVVGALNSRGSAPTLRFLASQRLFRAGLFLLGAGAVIGALVGMVNGSNVGNVVADARPLLFLAALLIVPTLVWTEGVRPLLWVGAGATLATAALSLAQELVGPGHVLFVASSPFQELLTCEAGICPQAQLAASSFLRVRPTGVILALVAVTFALAHLIWARRRRTAPALVVLCAGALVIALSLNRNMVLSIPIGLTAVGLIVSRKHRILTAVAALALVALLLFSHGGDPFGSDPVTSRFAGALSVSNSVNDGSLKDRQLEDAAAFSRLSSQPFVGVGWGVPYGASPSVSETGSAQPRLYIHNQFLGLALKTGLLGLVGWLLLVVASVRLCIVAARDEAVRWLAAATAASIVALSMSSLVAIYILDVPGMSAFAALFGLALAIYLCRGEPSVAR